ncbi:MAG TPA: HNH endonuclease signature motif containing protein [Gemmataceae bacterium]|nr:HNH endonuclease signature motif containing protein [Gemmataceae bacterium]
MDEALVRLVWQRAHDTCEYCRLAQAFSKLPFHVDHIKARHHGGQDLPGNLGLACFYCNSYKGSNIAGEDPRSRAIVRLFHPRRHKWSRHFRWDGPVLIGRTPIGRATIAVLKINDPKAVATRAALIEAGVFPPA